ncbi:MAG: sigma-54 dependent transcriptional regulator [Porphyromonadaceae bacterium]|nr:sigma-54 dependent transcriptional regulator [Porphyromonadaceae bacterium]
MIKDGTLLVVDDNASILTSIEYLLNKVFSKIITLRSPKTIPSLLRKEKPEVVLLDMNFSSGPNTGNEGLFWLAEIKRLRPQTEVVLFTAYADIDLAVEGIKRGAADFVVKPWNNEKLIKTLQEAYQKCISNKKTNINIHQVSDKQMYWGRSKEMLQLREIVQKTALTDANILITGENGTGKDMLAQEIHKWSKRCSAPFVCVDMGAITESLFESELFGHVKGAFTDAHTDRTGRFEAADGGTLFLDEIGNLPLHMQPKLLTAIQKKCYTKVGSNELLPTNIRLISATNMNLQTMVNEGTFREDLLYRINTIHLHIPSLRERREDIIPLSKIFIEQYVCQYGTHHKALSKEAEKRLNSQSWPGNIRQLQHTLEKAVILSEGDVITENDLQIDISQYELNDIEDFATQTKAQTLEEMEESLIRKTIDQCNGNLSQAAAQLDISRQTLYNKMKRYGI